MTTVSQNAGAVGDSSRIDRGEWRYLRAFFSGHWQRRITGHYSNVPAACVVDAEGHVTYVYRGKGIGDYPSLDQVLDELAEVTR